MKPLKRIEKKCWYFVDGEMIDGCPSGLYGNVSGLYGNVSGLSGDVSGLSGNVSGLRGNVSGLSGDADEIPMSERQAHPDIQYWVEPPAQGKEG